MIGFDGHRLFDEREYPGLRIAGEFHALERYLALLAEFVPHIQDQSRVRLLAELKRKSPGLGPEDLKEEVEQLKWVTESLVPQFFFGAFVVALWAGFESAVTELAQYIRKRENVRLSIADLREPNTRKRLDLYLETITRQPIAATAQNARRIDDLQLVRNCLAHANGDLRLQREERKKQIEALAGANVGVFIRENSVVVSEEFIRTCFASVEDFVNGLLAQVHKAYPHEAPAKREG